MSMKDAVEPVRGWPATTCRLRVGGCVRLLGIKLAGLLAMWSNDKSRQSILAAMKRKETCATTGPRIALRLLASWDYSATDA
jgi:hypothetical protein